MNFVETGIGGVWLIELDRHEDDRGHFARTFCAREFASHGLCVNWVQTSQSFNRRKGTVRGLHYQQPPYEEAKLIQCVRGGVYDVVVDCRGTSPTRGSWLSFELTEENSRALYLPPGVAHGFQSLRDETVLSYMISNWYDPASARGVRWNDPTLAIDWPLPVSAISRRDQELSNLDGVFARLPNPQSLGEVTS